VVPRGSVDPATEARDALALGQHVGCDAGLARGQRLDEQIALQFGDAGPVLHIASKSVERPFHSLEAGQRCAFEIANTGEMFVYAGFVIRRQFLLQSRCIGEHGIENAFLAIDPACFLRSEETVRTGDGESFPAAAHVHNLPSSYCAACFRPTIPEQHRFASERKRESPANLVGDDLIDGRSGGTTAGESVPVMRPLIEFVWPLPLPEAAALSIPLRT